MWYVDQQCYFSIGSRENTDPNHSGTCKVEGHETLGYDYTVTDIIWYFGYNPSHAFTFMYQYGEWGPIAE